MAKPNDAAKTAADNDANPQNNPEYRKAVMEYFKENNLRPAQFLTGELQMSRILRAVYSERQLQEVMVDFWTNHFNVYAAKGADRWLLTSYDRDTIRPHTLGKFYDLLLADAQSPAMLFYLDNFQSVSPNAQLPQQRPGAARAVGSAVVDDEQQPAATAAAAAATRHQRKLRARVDGAAHAGRRWRLYPEGRAGSGALLYGLDHLSTARRRRSSGGCDGTRYA